MHFHQQHLTVVRATRGFKNDPETDKFKTLQTPVISESRKCKETDFFQNPKALSHMECNSIILAVTQL